MYVESGPARLRSNIRRAGKFRSEEEGKEEAFLLDCVCGIIGEKREKVLLSESSF